MIESVYRMEKTGFVNQKLSSALEFTGTAQNSISLRGGQLLAGHQPEMCFSYCVLMKAVLERVICV